MLSLVRLFGTGPAVLITTCPLSREYFELRKCFVGVFFASCLTLVNDSSCGVSEVVVLAAAA